MAKKEIALPTKPVGVADSIETITDDSVSLDLLIADILASDEQRLAAKTWRVNNTVRYNAGNKNRVLVEVFSISQLDIAMLPASIDNEFEHVFIVTVHIERDTDIRTKVLGLIGYNGTRISQLTSGGTIPTSQQVGLLLELDKRVRKAVHMADVFNENAFRCESNAVIKAMRPTHTPLNTDGALLHK